MKDDGLYVIHMGECIARIQSYTVGGRKQFFAETLVQDAVLRNLQTMGESSKRLSRTLKNRAPDIDWKKIAGFRNVLVHDYLGIDLDTVWNVIEAHLPPLAAFLKTTTELLRLPPPRVPIGKARKPTKRKKRSTG